MDTLRHYLNPLHLLCRLYDLGIPRRWAKAFCRAYERSIYTRIF